MAADRRAFGSDADGMIKTDQSMLKQQAILS
jgi:hypothetical protein